MTIIPFHSDYTKDFYELNVEWLQKYFYVEPYDEQVLSNPESFIISKGGHIFFAIENEKVIATVALIPYDSATYELTKMAVLSNQRGKKIGQSLLQYCIQFAKEHKKSLMLYSHTKLENAIHIYRKAGFREMDLEPNNPYERSNIKMILTLNT